MKKKLKITFVVFINILILTILLETITPFVYSKISKKEFKKQNVKNRLNAYSVKNETYLMKTTGDSTNAVLHPYLGFVMNTDKNISQRDNFFGFMDTEEILTNSKKTIKIVITGGSVAAMLSKTNKKRIIEKIRDSKIYKDKQIKIFTLAMGGFKQPQQLMALNYFLMLGSEFDIWINLDGFNEIIAPVNDNWAYSIASFYPRKWDHFSKASIDKTIIDKIFDLKNIRQSQNKINLLFSNNLMSKSSFFLVIYDLYTQRILNEEYKLSQELNNIISGENPTYQISGPFQNKKKWDDILFDSVKIWARSSLLMANICKTNGIKYLHFLQPNQYVDGSKKLTKEEAKFAYVNGPYFVKKLVRAGYPVLFTEGEKLNKSGVSYFDLSMVFKDENRSVYVDDCCHFNELGNKLIADRIIDTIINTHSNNKVVVLHNQKTY